MESNYIIKKHFLLVMVYVFCIHITMQAQNKPVTITRSIVKPVATPAPYTNSVINYIRIWEPSMPTGDTAIVTASGRSVAEVKRTTQYFDGLGRPLQVVAKGASPIGGDLVTPIIYDAFGREQYKYLPYVQQGVSVNDGQFKSDPFKIQKNFYGSDILNPGVTGDSIYYSQIEYEQSPLNRVLKTYAPGNSWAKGGGNHPIENKYMVNTLTDSVRIWNIIADLPSSSGIHAAGELLKNVLVDEGGSQVIEYKDKEGRIILKKIQTSVSPDTLRAHINWLCTYYVYDNLNNLRFVIPPLAVERSMITGWNVSGVADELCFQYQYDGRNRMIVKKVPGAGPVYLIYDTRDRLVFTQDANQRLKSPQEWLITFYDGLNRPTMTAIYKANTTQAALQTSLNTVTSATQSISYVFPGTANLVLGSYDGSSYYTATNSIIFQDSFDSGTGAEFIAEINPAGTGGTTTINATNPLPGISISALTPLTYTFYDNYNYAGALSYETGDLAKLQAGVNPYAETLPVAPSNMTNGIVTGTKVRVLDTDQWLTTTSYYDNKGRVIQIATNNSAGGKDIATNLYDFSGKVLSSYLRHTNPRSGQTSKITLLTMMEYDAAGRVLNVKKRLNDITNQDKTVVANSYDELGQLKQKRLGVTGVSSQLDTLSYTYNIRGWLQGINKAFVNTASTDNWFGQELNYDYGFTTNQYNGNIAGAKWKSKSDGITRAYGYSYDKVDRLTEANFTQQNTSGAAWTQNVKDFSVSNLTYDANGNIKSMTQKGMKGTVSGIIDQLTYSYPTTGSNKLSAVSDTSNTASAKLGDFINGTNTGNDYSYDVNGNLLTDLNKGISAITYNHLNLPANVVITGKGSITYQYDAAGNKQKKTVVDSTVSPVKTTITNYVGGFVYKQDTLQYVGHEEGRIRPIYKTGQPVSFAYDYFEKDHLGNVRVVLTDQTDFTMYTATMETAAAATETVLFSNIDATRTEKPAGYPEDNTTDNNTFVAKLNAKAGGNKIGPSLVLRIMAGDTVKINARAFYKSTGPKDKAKQHPAEEMVAGLLQAFGGNAADDTHAATANNNTPLNSNFYNGDYQRLKEKDPDGIATDRPKAYLNFVLFDDQFKLVDENSGVRQVKTVPDELQELGINEMVAAKSGFLYVYSSNETEQDVFFDNVVVAVNSGPLLEETHYYPFGLTMTGISSNALKGMNYPENRLKYNGIEFTEDLGLNLYDAFYRNLDPQIGRWNQIDPKIEIMEMWSPYVSNYNNPIKHKDPKGDCPSCLIGGAIGFGVDYSVQVIKNRMGGKDWQTSLTDINLVELGTATFAGAATAGISAIYESAAVTGTTMLLSETTAQMSFAGLTSTVNQVNDNVRQNKPIDISLSKITSDVLVDRFVGKAVSSVMPKANFPSLENQIDRASRVAVNSTRSGRVAAVAAARSDLSRAKAAAGAPAALLSAGISATGTAVMDVLLEEKKKNNTSEMKLNLPQSSPTRDNTNVRLP